MLPVPVLRPANCLVFLGRERADALMLGHHIRDDDQFPLQNAVDSQAAADRKSAYRVVLLNSPFDASGIDVNLLV
jgi:hypothetical protein